ncbi:hypothetical protein C9374_008400 [Naegleria lovaniensis]|uniref:Uncharacterized protein n=1 Tax=Naegleria lovaniensis TaxID=51637 RepID=A0AA88GJ17_NAELO|nr:uncharacterized protein C9374_008400 [Naegleria lovaniensis]KAG2378257.1 hypothetical protein C9374_008400 [Naegleria lovaniensis]
MIGIIADAASNLQQERNLEEVQPTGSAASSANTQTTTTTTTRPTKKYNTGGSSKKYIPSFFSEADCIVGCNNYDPYDQQPLLNPDEVVISTKNLIFEKYHGENHLLSSLKYTLRVCTVNCGLPDMWVKIELVCGNSNTPIKCVKKERRGKRGLKGRCYQEFDISKHGYLKAKLEFRFRETSSDNASDKFRLKLDIYNETTCLLTFLSPRFRTVVRSPQRGKYKLLREQLVSQGITGIPYEKPEDEKSDQQDSSDKSSPSKLQPIPQQDSAVLSNLTPLLEAAVGLAGSASTTSSSGSSGGKRKRGEKNATNKTTK